RQRNAWLRGARIGVVGDAVDLTYRYEHLGVGADALGKLGEFGDALKNAQKPMVVLAGAAMARGDGAATLNAAAKFASVKEGWNGFNVLHTAASRVGALDMGFLPGKGGKNARDMLRGGVETLLLLGVDEVELPQTGTVIYIGTHGDRGAHRADIVLPGAAYTEKNATWVNTEGRVQYGQRATFPKGEAKEDWTILRALSALIGKTLPYDSLAQLRDKMIADHPTFGHVDYAPGAADAASFDPGKLGAA